MKKQTGNQQLVKRINKRIVLRTIVENEPVSRAEIAALTGLNKGTVSSLAQELIDEQFIYESGPGKSSGGRRPVMLHFNERAGFFIGIDLGVHYILGMLTDLKGNIVAKINKNFTVRSYNEVRKFLLSIISELLDAAPESPYGVSGIGIAVPGLVNKSGEILIAPNLGWKNVHLKKDLESRFQIPVIMENEANAGAYGEKLFGTGKDYEHILYVSAGIGIGVGVILNGELYLGSEGFAGEAGHMMVEINGKECSCGSKGCWEMYASERALLAEAKTLSGLEETSLTIETLCKLAENGHSGVLGVFHKVGTYLGIGLHNLIHTFNPQLVIIGNRMVLAREWLEEPIRQVIERYTMKWHRNQADIHFSSLMTDAAAMGAAALAVEQFFNHYFSPNEK